MATEQPAFDSTSIFLPFKDGAQLHMRRFSRGGEGVPVLLLHGSIENGRIFYSESGKGFAPWLAERSIRFASKNHFEMASGAGACSKHQRTSSSG